MKLVCSQTELNAALQLVSRAVASRPTHPVLANVLLTADAGTDRLSLTGFDLGWVFRPHWQRHPWKPAERSRFLPASSAKS